MRDLQSSKRIFICYAREDLEIARRLHRDLQARGYETWIDFEDLLPGERWGSTITRAIKESAYFAALLSSRTISKRGFVQKEIKEALEVFERIPPGEIYLIPIRLDACTPVDRRLRECQWVDFFPSYQSGFQSLLRSFPVPPNMQLYPYGWLLEGTVNGRPWLHFIRKLPATIGRSSGCDIVLPRMTVSSKHAEILRREERTLICDLQSTNGIYIQGQKISGEYVLGSDIVVVYFADFEVRMSLIKEQEAASIQASKLADYNQKHPEEIAYYLRADWGQIPSDEVPSAEAKAGPSTLRKEDPDKVDDSTSDMRGVTQYLRKINKEG